MENLHNKKIIDSGFWDHFQIYKSVPKHFHEHDQNFQEYVGCVLYASFIHTPLGPMLCITDEKAVYLLEFFEYKRIERGIKRLRQKLKPIIIQGETPITCKLKTALHQYFSGTSMSFDIPIALLGTAFQNRVWQELQHIPVGETKSYGDIAKAINQHHAYRAVATANAANQLALIIPCHRVIYNDGTLGGYGGGVYKKQWLLNHEKITIKVANLNF